MNYELNKLYKFVNKNYLFKLYREKKQMIEKDY